MRGVGWGIDGDCPCPAVSCVSRSSCTALTVAFVISLLLHMVLFWLPVMPFSSLVQQGAAARSPLEIRFRGLSFTRVENRVASGSVGRVGESGGGGRFDSKRQLSAVFPAKDPELISDLEVFLEGEQARGFMILRLRILGSGMVDVAEIVHSTLPAALSESLLGQFAMAQYKAAEREGRVVDADLLLRVDVE